uniref:Alpha-D-phosphohexomutase alpha/beta/alpha domain-containing protein n=1 Tax=Zea mays TaxID=4577 RepID=A0A804MWH7_MAIZE|eukprot:XP_008670963.1 uncharacterized protein LOC103648252 [Zea mays]
MSLDFKLILDELNRRFDELEVRWDRRFSPSAYLDLPPTLLSVHQSSDTSASMPPTPTAAVGTVVIADNWGGCFDDDKEYYAAPSVVADNWGGLFEGCDADGDISSNLRDSDPDEAFVTSHSDKALFDNHHAGELIATGIEYGSYNSVHGSGGAALSQLAHSNTNFAMPTTCSTWGLTEHAMAEAVHCRALWLPRREPLPRLLRAFLTLERLDLSACASLDDASLAASVGDGPAAATTLWWCASATGDMESTLKGIRGSDAPFVMDLNDAATVAGGIEDTYGEDRAIEEQLATPLDTLLCARLDPVKSHIGCLLLQYLKLSPTLIGAKVAFGRFDGHFFHDFTIIKLKTDSSSSPLECSTKCLSHDIGHDSRNYAHKLQNAVTHGITAAGHDILQVGLASTPAMFNIILIEDERSHLPIDAICSPDELIKTSRLCALEMVHCRKPWMRSLGNTDRLGLFSEARAVLNAARQQAMKIALNMPQHQTCIDVMGEGILYGGRPGVLKEAIVCSIPGVMVFTWTVRNFSGVTHLYSQHDRGVVWLIVAPDCYFIQHNERMHMIFYGFDLLSLQHFHGHFIQADMFAPWDGQEITQFLFSELPIYWQQSHGEFFSASIIRQFQFISQLILLAITGMNSLLFFRKLKYSSSVEIFCGAQFSFPNILLPKSWSQELATNIERHLLSEMLEVANGYNFHELHLMLASIGVTQMISCGKYLIWIIGLLTPWDPGRMVFDLKFVMLLA